MAVDALAHTVQRVVAVDQLRATGLDVVIAAIQRPAHRSDFVDVTGNDILHERIGILPGTGRDFLQLLLEVWREMHFHRS